MHSHNLKSWHQRIDTQANPHSPLLTTTCQSNVNIHFYLLTSTYTIVHIQAATPGSFSRTALAVIQFLGAQSTPGGKGKCASSSPVVNMVRSNFDNYNSCAWLTSQNFKSNSADTKMF